MGCQQTVGQKSAEVSCSSQLPKEQQSILKFLLQYDSLPRTHMKYVDESKLGLITSPIGDSIALLKKCEMFRYCTIQE